MSDTLNAAIEELRKEVNTLAGQIKDDPRIADLSKKIKALNTLEELTSQEKTLIGGLLDFGAPNISPQNQSGGVVIGEDEFYGQAPLEAAKSFLRKKGKPAKLQEIMQGIKAGGGNPGSEKDLRIGLTRSTYQIAKINEDLFGLVEFYSDLKRGRTPKKKTGAEPGDEPIEDSLDDSATGQVIEGTPETPA